jgi:ferrous iron transport protein A
MFYEEEAVGAVLVVAGGAAEFAEAVLGVEGEGPRVGYFDGEAEPSHTAAFEAPQEAIHQDFGCAFAADGGIDGEGYEFGANFGFTGAKAGDGIPEHLSPPFCDQEKLPASAGVFCKQLAIVCVGAEAGGFDLEDTVQIAGADVAHCKSLFHSVILYFASVAGPAGMMARKKRKEKRAPLDKDFGPAHTGTMLQLSGNKSQTEIALGTLVDLRKGDAAILDHIELPTEDARRLMELGFLPGIRITAGFSAPGGDPQVFEVDGSEIALRRATARHLKVRREAAKTPRVP